MNDWKVLIEKDIEEAGNTYRSLRTEMTELRGASWTQQVTMAAMETQATNNLTDVAKKGMETMNQVIDAFRLELGRHEYAHDINRKALEQVVNDAEAKFKQMEEQAQQRHEQGRTADEQLRLHVQSLYDQT